MTITDEAREAWAVVSCDATYPDKHARKLANAIRSLTAQLMESEWKRKHRVIKCTTGSRVDYYCDSCGMDDPRHNWTKEQWERAAEEELSK